MSVFRLTLLAPALALPVGAAPAGEIVNPRVTTDRSVDASSVEAMVRSLVRPGMSDREKALAVYNYVRRTMFHYRHLTRVGGGGAVNLINGTGYTLCTPTASAQAEICRAAGLKKAFILGTPGHGSFTVFYAGKWHWMDAFIGGCAWDGERKTIASLAEVVANPKWLTREKPSPVPFLPCKDVLYADALRFEPGNEKYHKACAPDDAAWTLRAKPGKKSGPYWKSSMKLDITLRPGESYLRRWDHEPGMYFLTKVQKKFAPPHHFCGAEYEKKDTVNWPYWKPYLKEITSFDPKTGKKRTVRTGRYWANGRLSWKPAVTRELLKHLALAENVRAAKGALRPAAAGEPAVLEWQVKCPYMLQGGWLRAKVSGKLAAAIKVGRRGKFQTLALAAARGGRLEAELRPFFLKAMGTRQYTLRLELSGKGASLGDVELITVFQHNMYALPQLMPGKNRVRVAVANPEALEKTRLLVEYAWDQDGKTRKLRRRVQKSPTEFVIEVPGKELPRMRHLSLTNAGPTREGKSNPAHE